MQKATFLISTKINETNNGLHVIKGFLATSDDEEYNATIARHLNSTVAWICWDQMLQNIIRVNHGDIELAITTTLRDYKLRSGKNIMYMRKYANDQEVSNFIEQVDNFIRDKILQSGG